MRTIMLECMFQYDDEVIHGDSGEDKDWFINSILLGQNLCLTDKGDIGDELGEIKIRRISWGSDDSFVRDRLEYHK